MIQLRKQALCPQARASLRQHVRVAPGDRRDRLAPAG